MPLELTDENIDEMKTKIEIRKLHLKFQHAIIATRFLLPDLNVHHIWIDSLCIIQRSQQDFEIEAPKWDQFIPMQLSVLPLRSEEMEGLAFSVKGMISLSPPIRRAL